MTQDTRCFSLELVCALSVTIVVVVVVVVVQLVVSSFFCGAIVVVVGLTVEILNYVNVFSFVLFNRE